MVDGLVIRDAVLQDAGLLGAIEEAADRLFVTSGHPEIAGMPSISFADAEVAIREGQVTVAELDGSVVGWALVERDGDAVNLEQVSVHPEAGRRGIGASLLGAVVAAAQASGASWMTLDTQSDVPWNAPWYRRFGFEVVERSAWTDEMHRRVANQQALGLDWATRVFMRLAL